MCEVHEFIEEFAEAAFFLGLFDFFLFLLAVCVLGVVFVVFSLFCSLFGRQSDFFLFLSAFFLGLEDIVGIVADVTAAAVEVGFVDDGQCGVVGAIAVEVVDAGACLQA